MGNTDPALNYQSRSQFRQELKSTGVITAAPNTNIVSGGYFAPGTESGDARIVEKFEEKIITAANAPQQRVILSAVNPAEAIHIEHLAHDDLQRIVENSSININPQQRIANMEAHNALDRAKMDLETQASKIQNEYLSGPKAAGSTTVIEKIRTEQPVTAQTGYSTINAEARYQVSSPAPAPLPSQVMAQSYYANQVGSSRGYASQSVAVPAFTPPVMYPPIPTTGGVAVSSSRGFSSINPGVTTTTVVTPTAPGTQSKILGEEVKTKYVNGVPVRQEIDIERETVSQPIVQNPPPLSIIAALNNPTASRIDMYGNRSWRDISLITQTAWGKREIGSTDIYGNQRRDLKCTL